MAAAPVSHEQLSSGTRDSEPPEFIPQPERTPLVSHVTRLLSASLDTRRALAELTRIIRDNHGCRCIIDVVDPTAPLHIADVTPTFRAEQSAALEALVSEVVARGGVAMAPPEGDPSDARLHLAADHARTALDVTWLVSAPLTTDSGEILGAITTYGDGANDFRMSQQLALEVGHSIAVAVQNARLFRDSRKAARQREEVLAVVAHELGNPLSTIVLAASQALDARARGTPPHTPGSSRQLEAIQRAARHMKKLVADLLDLASLDAGTLSMTPASCELGAVIRDAIADTTSCAAAAGVTVVADLPADLPLAFIDRDRITQVLVNLLSNAIKFTPGGGRVCVRAARVDGTAVLVAVEDCGCGIAPANIERVFERFWQAPNTATLGSGLGLAICRSIIQLAGGRIWVKSTLGVGTTVYCTMPALA